MMDDGYDYWLDLMMYYRIPSLYGKPVSMYY